MKLPTSLIAANPHLTEQEIKLIENLIVQDLSRLAQTYMSRERSNHTLGANGLVNETLLRVYQQLNGFSTKEHFYATAATIMRHVLVDYDRKHRAEKRGRNITRADVAVDAVAAHNDGIDLVEMNDALEKLEAHSPIIATVINLTYFGGLTLDHIARTTGLSQSTVQRHLKFGKIWLLTQLSDAKRASIS